MGGKDPFTVGRARERRSSAEPNRRRPVGGADESGMPAAGYIINVIEQERFPIGGQPGHGGRAKGAITYPESLLNATSS